MTGPDYRGNRRTLSARQDLFSPGQRVVMVDDWIETGSQAIAAEALVAACGALLVSVAVIVDKASAVARAELPTIMGLVRASEL
jgi:adenine phosphoribosyltransferase